MNNNQSQMMNMSQPLINPYTRVAAGGGYGGAWMHAPVDQVQFINQQNIKASGYVTSRNNNKNWKAKKGGYNLPSLKELQQQNRLKAKRYISKKKFNYSSSKSAPFAPRNTTSFLIRAKKAGGITDLVSPCPVTPAVLPTPIFSPSREVLVDMAKEEWGVDGYGSMKGLIRLRSSGNDDDEEGGSSESDVEEHVEVERRLDHDLSRFEMIYPNYGSYNLENRVDDQDTHIAQLEEENLMLKERLFFMEREFGNLRRRLQSLEMKSQQGGQGFVENDSENDSGSRGFGRSIDESNEPLEDNNEVNQCSDGVKDGKDSNESNKVENGLQGMDVMKGVADVRLEENVVKNDENVDAEATSGKMEDENANVDSYVD
uniref:uncharacterized protein LOC122596060 n=1 Tax=Erigeron canadensis TaxID=72917 RepID=UPI001CB8D81B|nr:uncharacterized protein LOC122596060 [Erigeron canadensis]